MSHTAAEKLFLYGVSCTQHGMLYNARELQRNIAARINARKSMP
ncbi:hypothetical protein HMPREF9997_00696 [Corynebacterium durum F0235]|uniref:Uncharacterized protein n=1 Tax=Corynebacterium durum F0235 TaxID=1035195 RepID=L1MK52_9CORY|nr:hypothetical protein HMPREF9997_00696 [Corynebacterium durum F0235]